MKAFRIIKDEKGNQVIKVDLHEAARTPGIIDELQRIIKASPEQNPQPQKPPLRDERLK